MRFFRRLGRDDIAWPLRRLHVPVPPEALVLEVGSGGNPFPRANVLMDAYEVTRERHFAPLVQDRPVVLGVIEDLPFRDDAFDFLIACHVVEHSNDVEACLSEFQRVARAGYIECPDSFFERINPYKDHRYEISTRDGVLISRRKRSWIHDPEIVQLYKHQVQPSRQWGMQIRRNPFAFHVRYFWSRDSGGIRHVDITPPEERSIPFQPGPSGESSNAPASTVRSAITKVIRDTFSFHSRRSNVELAVLLRCMSCRAPGLSKRDRLLVCRACGAEHVAEPIPRMYPNGAAPG